MARDEPFEILVEQSVLDRIRDRVERYPWDNLQDAGEWNAGISVGDMRRIVTHWLEKYDWRAVEARLNHLPNRQADVGGRLHFLHLTGSTDRPLILTHGWPSSFLEYVPLLEPLAFPERFGGNPKDGFSVIIPSLPGYAFSGKPRKPIGPRETGRMFHRLMTETLGYSNYIAHGGDWGSLVSTWMAHDNPRACSGLHLTMVSLQTADAQPETDEELTSAAERREVTAREGGYAHLQSTRPQTLSYAMNDSPAGVAAWIIEKFGLWSDLPQSSGIPDVFSRYSEDELLTNVMLYLVTNSFATSTWMYKGRVDEGSLFLPSASPIVVPTGVAVFRDPILPPMPRTQAAKSYSIKRWTEMPRGGHFAAIEQPDLLIADIRAFTR